VSPEDDILEFSNLKCELQAKLKLKRLLPERYIYVGKSFSLLSDQHNKRSWNKLEEKRKGDTRN
jgi:hypothetical protein